MLALCIALLPALVAASASESTVSSAARVPPVISALGGQVAWSPDGRWIAFIDRGVASPHRGLYVVDSRGGRTLRLIGSEDAILARWSPDSRRIAWWGSALRFAVTSTLSISRLRGDSQSVEGDIGPDFSWSPDGKQLVYERRTTPAQTDCGFGYSVFVASATGDGQRQLVAGLAAGPEWSPDGSEIAFTRYEPGSSCSTAIEAVRPDGSGERTFARRPEQWVNPHWSPSGDLLAYPSSGRAYVVNRDGSGERSVGAEHWLSGLDFAWSPNGGWLAAGGAMELVLVNVSGGSVAFPRIGGPFSWSPSGNELLFDRGGIVTVGRLDGSEAPLVSGLGADWSPDGSRIAFLRQAYPDNESFRHCSWQLYVADADGTDARPVSSCRVEGTNGADSIPGTPGPDVIFGFAGDDDLRSGPGADTVVGGPGADMVASGGGRDTVIVRGQGRDAVSCGPGRDLVLADRKDRVGRDCEAVRRRR